MTIVETSLDPAVRQRAEAREEWVLSHRVKAVALARRKVVPAWHLGKEPPSLWSAVFDAGMLCALAQHTVAMQWSKYLSDASFVERQSGGAKDEDAFSEWLGAEIKKEKLLYPSFPSSRISECKFLGIQTKAEKLKFTLGVRVTYGETDHVGSLENSLWEADIADTIRVMSRWNQQGDKFAVSMMRASNGVAFAEAQVSGVLECNHSSPPSATT